MSTQTCRSCGSSERYSKEVFVRATHCHILLPVGGRIFPKVDSRAAFEVQVCGDCGLVEWFVPKRLLAEVKEKFSRVAA
jgi:hypothetical protein